MKKSIICILFCLGLFFSQNFYGQVFDKNELSLKIDDLIPKAVNDSTPGLVIGIVNLFSVRDMDLLTCLTKFQMLLKWFTI